MNKYTIYGLNYKVQKCNIFNQQCKKTQFSFLTTSMFLMLYLLSVFVGGTAAIDFEKFKNISIDNYTSCEQFVANYTFDYNEVLDIDWKIFYFWNHNFEESYNIKFNLASKMLTDRFRFELDEELKPRVNWSNALLFMETSIDFSGLFIRTNVSGIFLVIPSLAFEYSHAPQLKFALKVVKPGYLGILNCKHRLCYALAPANKMPHYDLLEQEAQKLGFWSDFGRTHLAIMPPPPTMTPEQAMMDDDDEDEHLELLHNENMQFL